MIETKLFEIRDRATFIPVMAILMRAKESHPETNASETEAEAYLLARTGFRPEVNGDLVVVVVLSRLEATYSPHDWNCHTLEPAHRYISEQWPSLKSGDVIDVEFIKGESTAKKISERLDCRLAFPVQ